MKSVVIIGAGAHGREVAEILRQPTRDQVVIIGFIDDNPNLHDQRINDLPVVGDWKWFEGVDRNEVAVICASGFSRTRKQMADKATSLGLKFANALSPEAYISPYSKVGEGVVMYARSMACNGALIANHVAINVGAVVSHDTRVDAYSTLNPGVNLAGNVIISEGCLLGIGCNVIQGISIGAWSVVGAGATVIRDLPDNVTAVGVPAKIIETRKNEPTIPSEPN